MPVVGNTAAASTVTERPRTMLASLSGLSLASLFLQNDQVSLIEIHSNKKFPRSARQIGRRFSPPRARRWFYALRTCVKVPPFIARLLRSRFCSAQCASSGCPAFSSRSRLPQQPQNRSLRLRWHRHSQPLLPQSRHCRLHRRPATPPPSCSMRSSAQQSSTAPADC